MEIKDVENYVILSRVYGRMKESSYRAQQDKIARDSLEKQEQEYALREEIARKIAETKGEEYNLGFFVSHDKTGYAHKTRCTKEEWLRKALSTTRSESSYMSRYSLEGWNPKWGDVHKEFDRYCTGIWGEFSYDHDINCSATPFTGTEDFELQRIQNRYTWREVMEDLGVFGGDHCIVAILGSCDGLVRRSAPPLFKKEEEDEYGTYSLVFDRLPIYVKPSECANHATSSQDSALLVTFTALILLAGVFAGFIALKNLLESPNLPFEISFPLSIILVALVFASIPGSIWVGVKVPDWLENSWIFKGRRYSRAFYTGGKYGYTYPDDDFWYDPDEN